MPDTASITVVKRMTYRGQNEEWGNTYHFTGTTPGGDAAWKALGEAIWGLERACLDPDVKLVKLYGYAPGNEHSVFQLDYVTAGLALTAGTQAPGANDRRASGDQAAWVRGHVGTSSKGKKVYVRKYFHGVAVKNAAPDEVSAVTQIALGLLLTGLLSGNLPGGAKWSGPQGAAVGATLAGPMITTRTLKRRGKRP